MSDIKVSIIVPVYNAEKYLKECLDSLIKQTLREIEIICINDGSTDSSLDILEEYAKNDSRIRIINQENRGVSVARNKGIKEAKGEYLTFVDSDDWIKTDALEVLYKTATGRNSDIVLFSYYHYHGTSITKDNRLDNLELIAEDKNIKFSDYYEEILKAPRLTCGKFYRTEFLQKNNILFPLTIKCGEDHAFFVNTVLLSKTISVLNTALYYYRLNVNCSLTKNALHTVSHTYKVSEIIKNIIYSSNLKNKDDIYISSLHGIVQVLLFHWHSIYNIDSKKENFDYIKKIEKEYKPYSKRSELDALMYKRLKNAINNYKCLFIRKLLEPVYEFECAKRFGRMVLYLFERQVINIDISRLERKKIDFRYGLILLKLRFKARFKKIKVAFLVSDISKWTCQSFYDELKNSKNFEPIIYVTLYRNDASKIDLLDAYKTCMDFFEKRSMKYETLYNIKDETYIPIEEKKADIIFYQQPWGVNVNQYVQKAMNFALTAYIPYCFYSMDSIYNYLSFFHAKIWRYFVETFYHKEKYEKEYDGFNCYVSGSVKLDNYQLIDREKIIKNKGPKKRIIYAPHHSLKEGVDHVMATFQENGKFILELAKKHPETEWIFRPHPVFADRLLLYDIMTKEEIDRYYEEWAKIGTISTSSDNYYEQFVSSDCLITDCISFLSEYLPSGNPVIHLRRKEQLYPFNDLLKKITSAYYQSHNNEELNNYFEEVVIKGNDYLKEQRQEVLKLLIFEENQCAGRNIKKYLEQELRIK